MNHQLSFSLLPCAALLLLVSGCDPNNMQPIDSASSSSSTGSGGTGGGSTTSGYGGSQEGPCVPSCGSAEVCVEGQCHGLVQLDEALSVNEGVCTIVLDAANVYWKTSDLRRVPKAGGPSTLLDSSTSSPAGLVVDDTYLYWTSFGIQRVEKTSPGKPGTTAGIIYAYEGGSPTRLVGDGSTLYYLEGYSIYQATTSGPPAPQAPPTEFCPTWSSVEAPIAVDQTSVYLWTEGGSVLTKVDKDDGKSVDIASHGNSTINSACGIVVDDSGVYFSTAPKPGHGGLVRRAGDQGALVDDASGADGVFTVDADTLYFMTPSAVMKMPKTGGAAVVLSQRSPPSPFPTCIAVDGEHVYWVDGSRLLQFKK